MSRIAPRPFSLALGALADRLAPATTLARVQRIWERAAGDAVARACRPTGERDGVLTVTCSEAVWAQELDLMGAEVVARLNEALGERLITSLRCRTG
jgi:predicted nucleic acid-binding Zn ribbon protein